MCSFFKITIAMLGCVLVLAGCTHDDEVEIVRNEPRVSDPSPEQMRDAQAIIRVVNEFRTENGLPPLILEAHLMHAALVKANDFRKNWRFYHAGSDGSTPDQRVSRAGYLWVAVGETLAAAQATARGAVGNL
ncbi:MAG: CAP domain-containing protein [Rhodospirillaceae bacterium]|nr:CAP domain-containing protein [Rhodospirillaceae bacterium]